MLTKIEDDLKQALKEQRLIEVSTLRLFISEIKNAQIAKGQDLSDAQIIEVALREAKKRQESIEAYKGAGRLELAEKEEAELSVLKKYLPTQMSDEDLRKQVEDAIAGVGATSLADMGKVMGAVMSKVKGQANGDRVISFVKELL